MFDPERDEDYDSGRFYLRVLVIAIVTVAVCAVLYPSVTGFAASSDPGSKCVAVRDGWHVDATTPPGAQRALAPQGWDTDPGACVRESRKRLLVSGIGLGVLGLACSGFVMFNRARRGSRLPAPAIGRSST
jgi:hypothetical protein